MNDYPNNNNFDSDNNNGLNNNYNDSYNNFEMYNNDSTNNYPSKQYDDYSYSNAQNNETGFVLIPDSTPQFSANTQIPPVQEEINNKRKKAKPNKPKREFKKTLAIASICSILGGSFLGLGLGLGIPIAQDVIIPQMIQKESSKTSETTYSFADAKNNENDIEIIKPTVTSNEDYLNYAEIVKKVEPSVVRITSVAKSNNRYFGIPTEQTGQGSGIIYHEDNEKIYIATNYHVVYGANAIMVAIENKEPVEAKIVGSEPPADIAVISVAKTELEKVGIKKVALAAFGDSDSMQTGDEVLAIGNALGEGNTVTNGIIGAKDKEIRVEGRTLKVIQTNAAINPGNSGGPLVNMKGEVIGINTAKLLQTSYSGQSLVEGMGYSIASNIVKPIIEQLMNPRPLLGITGANVTEEMAQMFNLPQIGVLIEEVVPGGAADEAGLKSTDIITSYNGKAIFNMEQLLQAIKESNIGDKVELNILREGQQSMTVTVVLKSSTDS